MGDVMVPETLRQLPRDGTYLYAVGYDRLAGYSLFDVYTRGVFNVVQNLGADLRAFVYVSSTGVYGQNDGSWIDEEAECRPTREGGRACLEAERILRDSVIGPRVAILRMAGIYGPERVPMRSAILAGEPLNVPAAGYLNLIHVEDAVELVLAAAVSRSLPGIWNISDGAPVLRRDYFTEIARSLGVALPPFVSTGETAAGQRAQADKRISNDRMRRELPYDLRFPNYREGLAQIARQA